MSLPKCDECEVTREELLRLMEASRQSEPGPNATAEQLAAWFDQREADQTYMQRVRPRVATLRADWLAPKRDWTRCFTANAAGRSDFAELNQLH
jgi:hypothetical protein